ncbi:sensor histidine kinase [Flavobacterium sp.]|uniref:sensor histidine kinase n=1 Tax=Flavobacterium sp. TaxID=239 RepID=UPI003B9A2801
MSEFRQSEEMFRDQREAFLSKLLSQIPDLIFQMTAHPDGRITFPFLSDAVYEHFELTKDEEDLYVNELLGLKIIDEDLPGFFDSLAESKKTLQPWNFEFRSRLPIKGLRYFRIRATVERDANDCYQFYGRVNDNTTQRIQALKLKISEERYQFALEASSEGIWDWDVLSDTVFFSSQSMKMLGFEEKDVVLQRTFWDSRLHPDDRETYQNDIDKHFEGATPYYENLQRIMDFNEHYKWILSRGKIVFRDSGGKPKRVIGTHTDFSFRIKQEEELKKTLEILSEQNKRLLNFAHIVSHNLRSYAGNFEMLLDLYDEETDEEIRNQSLMFLRSNSRELSQTIDNLKALVDIHSDLKPIRRHLNLAEYVHKMIALLSEEFAKHEVECVVDIPCDFTVLYNPAYLESILLNFSTNAVKYSHPNRKPLIRYELSYEDGKSVLSIKDNGLGIDLKLHQNSIFGMYKTFHKHPNSRGLGLFMSKNQIEAMGGTVKVNSEVNVGTEFKIYFNE